MVLDKGTSTRHSHALIDGVMPDQTMIPSDLEGAIEGLRHQRDAVILAHYYQDEEIQDIADFVGDSLDLSRRAAATDAKTIVFCGVRFMAEVAKILSPTRDVLLPDMEAGCSLEDSCPPDKLRAFQESHPDHVTISYINCSAEVKALSDIIVTSANAQSIIEQIPKNRPILFAPDRHLGAYLIGKTGRQMTLWPGACVVHEQFSFKQIIQLKHRYPEAIIVAHPECPASILNQADHVGSTSSMLHYVGQSSDNTFIVATERHLLHQMKKRHPKKTFMVAPGGGGDCQCAQCPFMALNTMEKLYLCLATMQPAISLGLELRHAALKPLERMLRMSKNTVLSSAQSASRA